MLERVPDNAITKAWPACLPLLRRAIDRSGGQITPALVEHGLISGQLHLWTDPSSSNPVAVVTALNDYEAIRVLSILLIGGAGMKNWLAHVENTLAAFARDNGCGALEAYVRPGLIGAAYRPRHAALRRWRPFWTLVRMPLTETPLSAPEPDSMLNSVQE